ncbi:unnamed protein product, partial [Heterotrigona itama]
MYLNEISTTTIHFDFRESNNASRHCFHYKFRNSEDASATTSRIASVCLDIILGTVGEIMCFGKVLPAVIPVSYRAQRNKH